MTWPVLKADLEEKVKARQDYLLLQAEAACADHWREAARRQEDGAAKIDRAQYMISCNRGRAGVLLHWKRTWPLFDGRRKKVVQRSAYVKLGEGVFQHTAGHFPKAAEWELDLIKSIEARLAPIRRESLWLARLAQLMANHPPEVESRRRAPAKATAIVAEAADLPEEAGW